MSRQSNIEFLLREHANTLKMLAEAEYERYDDRGRGDFVQACIDGKIAANAMFITFRQTLCLLMMSTTSSSREEVGIIMRFPLPYPEIVSKPAGKLIRFP